MGIMPGIGIGMGMPRPAAAMAAAEGAMPMGTMPPGPAAIMGIPPGDMAMRPGDMASCIKVGWQQHQTMLAGIKLKGDSTAWPACDGSKSVCSLPFFLQLCYVCNHRLQECLGVLRHEDIHLANATGWLFTEIARQPWIVFGLQKTADAVSPNVSTGMVLFSLIGFTLVYAVLMVANIYLLLKFARGGAGESSSQAAEPAELPGGTPAHAYLK